MSSPMNFSSPMDAESSRFSPFSPFIETSYSSDNCDTAETPLTVHAERDTFSCHFEYDHDFIMPSEFENTTTYHEFGSNSMDDLYFPAGTISPPFPSSSSTGESSQRYLDPSLSSSMPASETASACTALDPTEIDPFDAAFAARNEERVTQAPLLVQTSFTEACRYSSRFPAGHLLNSNFVHTYDLGDELGSGGYGFVMTAFHRVEGREVAVKFIVKDKVSEYGWTEDEIFGKLPTEVMLLSLIEHENIVKCLDLFEDRFYFYLVQELHGSPWKKAKVIMPVAESSSPLPLLSPSASEDSMADFGPITPLQSSNALHLAPNVQIQENDGVHHVLDEKTTYTEGYHQKPPTLQPPQFSRRPSHDLFECIEQTPNKRLSEDQARYIFGQVVEAAYYLENQGITHRDIKDENLVIDNDLKVKLIDFGSAVITDPTKPRPFYKLFFGTTAYASSEILRRIPYQAPPAEVWTLGVLLSYLLTGMSPFPTEKDAIEGRIILADTPGAKLSRASLKLMRRCLEPDPKMRATIEEIRTHRWLEQGRRD